MFLELKDILKQCSLNMTISMKGDSIAVTVIPKGKDDGKSLSLVPFVSSHHIDTIDDDFADEVRDVLTKALPSLNNAHEFIQKAEEKEKQAKEEKAKPVVSSTANKGTSEPTFGKNDTPKFKKVQDIIKRIGVTNDVDMISFAEKEATKLVDSFASNKEYVLKLIADAAKKQRDTLAKKDKDKAKPEPLVMDTPKAVVKDDKSDDKSNDKTSDKNEEDIDESLDKSDDDDDNNNDNDPDADASDENITADSDNSASGESKDAPPIDEAFF